MRIRLLPLLLLVVLLAACQEAATPEPQAPQQPQEPALKIGFINQETVFRDSKPGQQGMDMLGAKSNEMREMLDEMRAKAEAAEAGGDEEEMVKAGEAFQAKLGEFQAQMQAEQERIVLIMTKSYHQAMEDYREANGISVIFPAEQAVAYDKELDITAGVIAILDEAGVDFSAPAESAPTESTPAESAPAEDSAAEPAEQQ